MINFGDNETFIQNYEELKSSYKMAELYNCDRKSITTHATKIGYDYTKHQKQRIFNQPIEDVITAYEELGNADKVGEKFNCSGATILKYLKKNGYTPRNKQQKLANISDKEFIQKYEELQNTKALSEFYNCSANSIRNRIHKLGLTLNQNYKLSEEDKQFILNNYENITSNELAKKFNVSRGMITKLWYDANLKGKVIENPNTTKIDLTGQTFGLWTVIKESNKRDNGGNVYWLCRCKCGVEKEISSASLRNGRSLSCGAHSNISAGNEKIKTILQKENIKFELEKKFPTCKDKKELPFDFYVNNEYLIEYDGVQHFEESIFDYEYTHSHDLIKNQWCKDNNIPLIRIPYTHYNNITLIDLIPTQDNPFLIR